MGILAKSHHSGKFGDSIYCDKSDLMFSICHVTLQLSLTVNHHTTNFGGFSQFSRENKIFSICHAILKDHVFKRFNVHWSYASEDITYLTCHLSLQEHATKRFCDFIEGSSSFYRTTLPSLVGIAIVVIEIKHI